MTPDWLQWPETKKLVAAFAAEKTPLRFVGGAVRDALLGRPVIDVDGATPLLPDAVMALLQKAGIRALPTGIDHGTVTALVDKKHFEITTLRRDMDTDGRHATVAYTDDWRKDAERRDFTFNALYLSPEGELVDYFTGADDAKMGKVRFIGDAATRISEDYLRILRFFRFYAWFGKGEPDAPAMAACADAAGKLTTLSGERIQQEMFKLLAAPKASAAIGFMQKTGVLAQVLGMDVVNQQMEKLEAVEQKPDIYLRLALLLSASAYHHAALEHVVKRWKLSNADAELIDEILEAWRHMHAPMSGAERKKLLRCLGPEVSMAAATLSSITHGIDPKPMQQLLEQWYPHLPDFPLRGEDLLAIGMKPGKELGQLLQQLENWWEENDYGADKAALLARAKAMNP